MSLIYLMASHTKLELILVEIVISFTTSFTGYLLPCLIPVNSLYTGRMVFPSIKKKDVSLL